MKIGVCVKPVIRTDLKPVIKNDDTFSFENLEFTINPYDEYAIEEALKYKDKFNDTEIVSYSLGCESSREIIFDSLSMGVDRAVFLRQSDNESFLIDSYEVAQYLYSYIKNDKVDIIIMGKESVDTQNGAVGVILSTLLGWPVLTNIHELEINNESNVIVKRNLENGIIEECMTSLPCIVTVTKGINKPRYPNIMGIMKSRSKPVLDIDIAKESPNIEICNAEYATRKNQCQIISDDSKEASQKLVQIMQQEFNIL